MINQHELVLEFRSRAAMLVVVCAIVAGCGGGGGADADAGGGGPGGGPTTFGVSGVVTSAFNGAGVPDVTVRLSGAASASTATAQNGQYNFSGLANGMYTVSVSLADAVFDPDERTISVNGSGASHVDFLALRGVVVAAGLDMLPQFFNSSNQLRASVIVADNDVLFTDSSDFPLKKQPLDGSPMVSLAGRFRTAGSVAVHGGNLYWIEGARLLRTSPDGITALLATGRGEPGTAGLGGLVFDDAYVYWVDTDPQSPCSPSCTWDIQRIPLGGGAPETLATADRLVVSLAGDANRVYWGELGFEPLEPGCNCGSEIRSVPKAGGVETLLVDGTLNGSLPPPPPGHISGSWMPTGGLAVTATEVVFAAAGDDGYTLYAIPVQGGNVRTIASSASTGGFSQSAVIDIRVSGTNLYWLTSARTALMTVPLAGGNVTELASGLSEPVALVVNGGSAIWTESGEIVGCCRQLGTGSIRQVPLAGGAVTELIGDLDLPVSLAVDDENLYWTEMWRVATAPKIGGAPATLYSGIENDMARIALVGSDIYILDGALIKVLPATGGMPEKFAAAHFGAADDLSLRSMDIAADATSVFWTVKEISGAPVVQKAALGDGNAEIIAVTTAASGPQDCYWRILVDAQNVYWSSGSAVHPVGCRVNRAPLGGGAVTTVVDHPFLIDFTVDGANVYFSEFENVGSILRTPIGGGALTPVADDVLGWVLSDGGNELYWLDLQRLSILRIAKAPGTPTSSASEFPVELAMDPFLAFEALVVDGSGVFCTETLTGSIYFIY